MKGYREALGNFALKVGGKVKDYFDLQSEERKRLDENIRILTASYCRIVNEEYLLRELAERRNALNTESYNRMRQNIRSRRYDRFRQLKDLDVEVVNRCLMGNAENVRDIKVALEDKFGVDNLDFDNPQEGSDLIVFYSHRLEGKLTLFLDQKFPSFQYETAFMVESMEYPVGIKDATAAEHWLMAEGFDETFDDFLDWVSEYIMADPHDTLKRQEQIHDAVSILERVGLNQIYLLSLIHEQFRERRIPFGHPDNEIVITKEGIQIRRKRDEESVYDKDLQRAALGIVLGNTEDKS